ncbi:MAG: S-adenosylmethionine:tRNA ribosyltransferase-isomerase [Streptococcus salivarius]
MNTNDFDFELPEELIAQTPLKQRDASKLLVIDPVTKEMTDTHFDQYIDQPHPRCLGYEQYTVLQPVSMVKSLIPTAMWNFSFGKYPRDQWVLAKPAKRLKVGAKLVLMGA